MKSLRLIKKSLEMFTKFFVENGCANNTYYEEMLGIKIERKNGCPDSCKKCWEEALKTIFKKEERKPVEGEIIICDTCKGKGIIEKRFFANTTHPIIDSKMDTCYECGGKGRLVRKVFHEPLEEMIPIKDSKEIVPIKHPDCDRGLTDGTCMRCPAVGTKYCD